MNRRIRNSIVMVLLSCMCMIRAYGQEFHRTEIGIDFRVNRAVLDTTYLNNSEKIQEIIEFVTFLQTEHPYIYYAKYRSEAQRPRRAATS